MNDTWKPTAFDRRQMAEALLEQLAAHGNVWLAVRYDGHGWEIVKPRSQEAIIAACSTVSQPQECNPMQDDIVERLRVPIAFDRPVLHKLCREAADLLVQRDATILSLREQLEKACAALRIAGAGRVDSVVDVDLGLSRQLGADEQLKFVQHHARSTLQQIKDTPA